MSDDSKNTKGNIIIVDDTPANLHLLSRLLTEEGYEVRAVLNGRLALVGANAIPPDLILLDIKMPEIDGYEVCARLKANEKTQKIPVIFLSALDDVEDKIKGFACGGVDYITKPFHPEEVIVRVQTHLDLKFSRERLEASYQIIKTQQEQIETELEQAQQTQLAILPKALPQIPKAQIFSKFVPTQQVGGDIYQIFELDPGKYGIMIADVTGHGIPAALISFMVSGIFKDTPKTDKSTSLTIKLLNQALIGQMPERKFASMFYGVYDSAAQTLLYTNAGHPPGLIIRTSTNEILELHTDGAFIGVFSNQQSFFEEKTFQLVPGDKLLLYTDGLIDIFGDKAKKRGISRIEYLINYIKTQSHLPIEEFLERIFQYGLSHSSQNHFKDDCTMIGLDIID